MSDYRDVVLSALTHGFYLDSCGESERNYTWGSFIDLCGMSVEEAMSGLDNGEGGGGGDAGKTKNTITFVMQKGTDNEYSLYLTASQVPNSDVTVSFSMDGETQVVTMPAGVNMLSTGLKGKNPSKPYAVISSPVVNSDDEQYTYSTKNNVKTGIFTLTINNNGNKVTEQVQYGEEVTLPTVAEREGYDFKWTDANGTEITGSTYTMPEANATITGKYIAKSYTLTYVVKQEVLNGDEVSVETLSSSSATLTYGTKIWNTIKNLTPAKTGYTLDGWKSSDGNVTSATTMPAKDLEVTNIYKLNKYTLTFNADGSQISSEQKYYGQSISAPQIPDKTGYTTIGWNKEIPATMPASNQTFDAVYEAIIYYIRYSVDGEEKYTEQHIYGDAISIRADESKVGYTFSGWDPATLPATMPAENISVSGTFTVNSYTLEYWVLVNGTEESDTPYSSFTVEYDTELTAIANPEERVGYTFGGWEGLPAKMPASDVTVTGNFSVNSYTLTFMSDGVVFTTINGAYGDTVPTVGEPAKEGYTFTGWDNTVPATIPASDMTFNAQFSINSYVLTYYVDGNPVEQTSVEYGTAIVPREETPREGWTFSGWDDVPTTMPAHDVDVHGTFSINSHTLAYYIDGTQVSASTVEYGTALTPAEAPEKVGYTFSGWTEVPSTMPDNDVRVDGWFNVNEYTLTFNLDGAFYSSITQNYGTDVTAPTVETVEGYTFSGWGDVPATMPAENMTFDGTYNINSHVATYYLDNVLYDTVTYEYGATINYPSVPKEGYKLKWTKTYETMPDSDIRIDGVYEEIVESKTIYYGSVPVSSLTEFDDYDSLSTYEYENGVAQNVNFVIPADPEWAEVQYWTSNKKRNAWIAEHMYDFYFMAPANTSVEFANSLGPYDYTALDGTIEIDGNEYKAYHADGQSPIEVDDSYTMIIKITKN